MIERAAVVAGTEVHLGIGSTGATHCVLRTRSGVVRAVLKRIPVTHVLAEALCALILRGWGLPVPTPYLVPEGDSLAFASADAGYPNLKQRLGVDTLRSGTPAHGAAMRIAMQVASTLSTAAAVAAADEALANRDRNLENILWDGETEAWIDHAYALGNRPDLADVNKLCNMALAVGTGEEFQHGAIAAWMALDRTQPAQQAEQLSDVADLSAWTATIAHRLNHLGERLLARFPSPDDLLSAV
mgnify:CR=1 FL=1